MGSLQRETAGRVEVRKVTEIISLMQGMFDLEAESPPGLPTTNQPDSVKALSVRLE